MRKTYFTVSITLFSALSYRGLHPQSRCGSFVTSCVAWAQLGETEATNEGVNAASWHRGISESRPNPLKHNPAKLRNNASWWAHGHLASIVEGKLLIANSGLCPASQALTWVSSPKAIQSLQPTQGKQRRQAKAPGVTRLELHGQPELPGDS